MVGDPARSAKTLLVTESSSLAKRLVFVLSFFIRCSQVFKQDLVVKSQPELSEPLVTYRLDSRPGGMEVEAPVLPSPPLCQSHSSPTLHPAPDRADWRSSILSVAFFGTMMHLRGACSGRGNSCFPQRLSIFGRL